MTLLSHLGRPTVGFPSYVLRRLPRAVVEPPDLPSSPEEVAMREAEFAVVQHYATEDQQRRVEAMSGVRTRDGRRRIWMEFDETAGSALCGGPEPGEQC